jgi:long-chain fatty acid transport protein
MSPRKTKLALATAVLLGCASSSAFATNGYFAHGYSTKTNGMVGAGVASADDAMAAALNPAGMVNAGDRADVGAALFMPLREYKVTGTPGMFPPFPTDTVESGSSAFLVPHFGINFPLGDGSHSFGVSVYGNGGMNTSFDKSDTPFGVGVFGGGTNHMDYMQLFVNASYSRKLSDNASVGVGAIMNYSRFKMDGLGSFAGFSVNPTKLSNNGYDSDVGFGLKVGAMANLSDNVSIGASYQSKISNTLDEYAGLFPNGGEFDIPPTATVGMTFKATDKLKLLVDVQQIWYSEVDALNNNVQALFNCMGGVVSNCLGGSKGAGFAWEDMTVYRLGFEYAAGDGMTYRAGISTTEQPIKGGNNPLTSQTLFNILAPGVVEEHFTVGFTKKLGDKKEFSMAFLYVPENSVKGVSAFTPTEQIELSMHQYQIEASYSW